MLISSLSATFGALRSGGRAALIPYITAGYPQPDATLALLHAYARAGADVIELGVPFSDPVADGPTIQRASQRALEGGATLAGCLQTLRAFREQGGRTPVVVFSYLNPVLSHGAQAFIRDATDAGAQGVLLTDLPVGGDETLEGALEASQLDLIRLIAPTTTPARARLIAQRAQGFIYYIARMGVTGASRTLPADLGAQVESLKAVATVPIAVGFGISTPEQAAAVAGAADGVVVGSALIDALDRGGVTEAGALLAAMRQALEALPPRAPNG